jgi:UDP-3-O-[3-hydroxymyristoyl] glucosamine N-acyltransferase
MNKKYELLKDDFIEYDDIKLYRIRALRHFDDVEAGEVGGYIEKEENLSHEGNAWVGGDARVFADALVTGDAWVGGDARVYDNAQVFEGAKVYGDMCVYGNAQVYGSVRVCGDARIGATAEVYSHESEAA